MACSAFARPLLKSHSSLLHHQPEKSKTLFSIPFINKPHPVSKTLFRSSPNAQFGLRASKKRNLLAGSTIKSKVRASAEGEAKSLGSDATYQEVFTWSSVILPFLFPALGGLLFGYDIGATSGATISLQSPELSGTTWFNLSAVQLGLAVSGSLYGALLGSILVYPIADFLGRRRELIIAALLYVLGGFVTAYAPGLGVFLIGRLLYGLGIGLAMHGAPLYIAETCPSQIRGTLISLKELFIVLGILLGYFVGSFQINAIGGWRYMYGVSAPIALIMGLGMWSLPPSPRWLLLQAVQGKGSIQELKEKAISALSKLRGRPSGDKVSEKQVEDSLNSLKSAYTNEESDGSIFEVFQGPSLKAFFIGGGLVLFQQITGQPSVLYYAGPILQSAGFSAASDATQVSVVIGLFKLLMTGVAVLKVDDIGRRPLLIGGVSGIAVSLFLLSGYYKFFGGFPFVAVAALLLYVGCYQLCLNSSSSGGSIPSSAFLGSSLKKVNSKFTKSKTESKNFKIVAEIDEKKQTDKDKWRGLAYDVSDDQQDITRGKGMVDSLFQAPMGAGTHDPVMSSYEYISTGLRQYNLDNNMDGFYIAPAFMDKLVVHITKNFMTLPNIKVPLILGIWGGKGQGKSFQCELVFAKMGINPIMMSAGELESGNAGEPAKLIRQRYREASDIIRKGKMCCLFINDLDAGAGRMGGTTQYTVNNQMVNATLMNIADNPTNVQLPGMYNKEDNPRVPIIVTGNDFSTLYAPLIRDGRMEKFYWAPNREDRIGVCMGIFRTDNVPDEDVVKIVDTFPGQSIDFFGALRARVYDDEVRKWISGAGVDTIGKKLVNSKEGPPTFEQPKMTLEKLLEYGYMLVQEQENVKRVQLADKYLSEAALGDANQDSIDRGTF